MQPLDYKQAGVDIAAGEKAVKAIKTLVRTTYNANVLSDLGSFGGLYSIDQSAWKNPVLVASTDGVGTKLRIAIMAGEYGTVGQDLVNHCVNDILVQGALPQFFLDYIGVGLLHPEAIEAIVGGMVKACRENGCALIGGEMAEMPGFYQEHDFDLAGTIIGMVERERILPRASMAPGDLLVALPSSGLHTNGYSLVRKLVFDQLQMKLDALVPDCGSTLGEELLRIHVSYLPVLKDWINNPGLNGLAHITGGGIAGNLGRIIPENLQAVVELSQDSIPPFFQWLQRAGNLSDDAVRQAFNLGVGMICVVQESLATTLTASCGGRIIGCIQSGKAELPRVIFG